MDCEMLQYCPFYHDKMPMDHGIGSIYKKKYCRGSQEICARYQVLQAVGPSYVSSALYPNMLDMAKKIIEDAKRGGENETIKDA